MLLHSALSLSIFYLLLASILLNKIMKKRKTRTSKPEANSWIVWLKLFKHTWGIWRTNLKIKQIHGTLIQHNQAIELFTWFVSVKWTMNRWNINQLKFFYLNKDYRNHISQHEVCINALRSRKLWWHSAQFSLHWESEADVIQNSKNSNDRNFLKCKKQQLIIIIWSWT